ncbi:hypothetical protein M8J77_013824 [Diaphorina citri]|nr:hypothetical protein M8J77_013824 [Diaphorina citri]
MEQNICWLTHQAGCKYHITVAPYPRDQTLDTSDVKKKQKTGCQFLLNFTEHLQVPEQLEFKSKEMVLGDVKLLEAINAHKSASLQHPKLDLIVRQSLEPVQRHI